nr:4019_t:CDS:10 [Entrophospora candida]
MSESSSYTEINSNNNNSTGSTDSNNSCSSRTSNKVCNECSEPYESLPWCYKCDLPKYSDNEYGSCNPEWSWSISDNPISDIGRDFLASDEYIANSGPSKGKLHPEAIYVSRFIKFPKIENDDNDISDSDDDGDSTRDSKIVNLRVSNIIKEESFEELSNSPESLKSPRSPGLQGFDSKQLVLTLSKAIPKFSSNQLRTVIETEENSQIDSQEGLTLSSVLNGLSLEDKEKYKINDEEVSLAAISRSLDSKQLDLCILKACLNGDDITESHQSSDVPGE